MLGHVHNLHIAVQSKVKYNIYILKKILKIECTINDTKNAFHTKLIPGLISHSKSLTFLMRNFI